MTSYVPLWCKSNFSFLEGASHPEELVEEARHLGLRSLALTDRDGVHGVVRAHLKAQKLGLHLIIGSQITIHHNASIILLVKDRQGYGQLCQLVSKGRLRSPKGQSAVSWQEVCAHAKGLIAIWDGNGVIPPLRRPTLEHKAAPKRGTPSRKGRLQKKPEQIELPVAASTAATAVPPPPANIPHMLQQAFAGDLFLLVGRHHVAEEPRREQMLLELAQEYALPLVAATEVLYHSPARRPLQDVLTCIRHGVTLSSAGRLTQSNAEHGLQSPHAFRALFHETLGAVENTCEIARRCHFSLSELRYVYPSERLPDGNTSDQWLQQLCLEGAAARYSGEVPAQVSQQLQRELEVIRKLEYCGYFLTMWEIAQYCREHNILCQGRGSAANSVVCYCLGITAIDPVRMGLLFERFLSLERAEPPDIDLDIMHERREEVIQYVYHKYGRTHAAMVAVLVRYRLRSAVREVGKAFAIPATSLDRLAKQLGWFGELSAEALQQAGLALREPECSTFIELVNEILDFPRHLSIHPGGFLLGHEPIHNLVPMENGSMEDRTVIQWDKDDVEALGLFKVDLLGLGALTQLDIAFELLRKHRGETLSMASIPPRDGETFDMICRGATVGVFQIESRAQMAMLPRLRPKNFYDLVIEVSIVRPGPISGGMVHPYLRRRQGEEAVTYPHPSLEPVLQKTLGVPIFQEQVMRLAVVAADYTPGEADQLRRDMAAWRRAGRIERHRHRLISRMEKKGIAAEFALQVFEQIRGFGEYGFPESHAASFALIAYATAYLKCHYPAEFCCSLLNAQPMGFYSTATIVEDAKRSGVEVRPINVLASHWDCTLEPEDSEHRHFAVRMGLRYIKGLGEADWYRIQQRQLSDCTTLRDFVDHSHLDEGSLTTLAEAGAFECFKLSRRETLWELKKLVRSRGQTLPLPTADSMPALARLNAFETVGWDYRNSHHSPRGHPLATIRRELQSKNLPSAQTLNAMKHGKRVRYAGLVICRQRPGTASGVTFMTLEDESGFVNVVVWTKVYETYRLILKTEAFIGVTGRLQSEQGVVHLIADKLWVPAVERTPAKTESRDFH